MRTIILSIFLVTVLTLTLQSIASAEKTEDNNESTGKELATAIKRSAVGRMKEKNGGMMMNMSAEVGHNNNNNSKDKDNALDNMMKIFMMCKAFIETVLMFVDPIFKAKNYGLSVIMTLISVGQFIMSLNDKFSKEKKKQSWEVENTVMDRIGMPYGTAYSTGYRPTYLAPYPTYMHKYRMPMTS
ncbi:unnamed protein product [Nezara viridula]|uniref:Neuropeptide n=1 Tax=Nezara viridula TaxID=85310 RepID=A0A9P0HGN5_NEZVI|nr:unnamed protein product [Nezara viridula]